MFCRGTQLPFHCFVCSSCSKEAACCSQVSLSFSLLVSCLNTRNANKWFKFCILHGNLLLRLQLGRLISSPCLEKTFVLQTEDRHLKVNLFGLPLLTSSADRENCFSPVFSTREPQDWGCLFRLLYSLLSSNGTGWVTTWFSFLVTWRFQLPWAAMNLKQWSWFCPDSSSHISIGLPGLLVRETIPLGSELLLCSGWWGKASAQAAIWHHLGDFMLLFVLLFSQQGKPLGQIRMY